MGRQRDPKRDEAFEIYKASWGKISLVDLAAQLGVGDGTLRGWKAKDSWDKKLDSGEDQSTKASEPKPSIQANDSDEEYDDLFMDAVMIVLDSQQASVSLLQRRMRIGYTRSARLIDMMERRGIVGPYNGMQPRKILIKEINLLPDYIKNENPPTERKERNAPKSVPNETEIRNVPLK